MSRYTSETARSQARERICGSVIFPERQNGIDLGFGGDPISVHSIAMDLPEPYAHTEDEHGVAFHQHLRGDACDLYWFKDGVLDYIYSSHLLEDYPNTEQVVCEWLRVLRPGGKLILLLPDEQQYKMHCRDTGQPYNGSHSQPDMSLEWMTKLLLRHARVSMSENIPPYSFLIVAEKQ